MQNYIKGETTYVSIINDADGKFNYAKLTILAVDSVATKNGVVPVREKLYAFTKDVSLTKPESLNVIRLLRSRTSKGKDGRKFLWVEGDSKLDA